MQPQETAIARTEPAPDDNCSKRNRTTRSQGVVRKRIRTLGPLSEKIFKFPICRVGPASFSSRRPTSPWTSTELAPPQLDMMSLMPRPPVSLSVQDARQAKRVDGA